MTLQSYIKDKKYIFWWVSDLEKLSDEAIVEWIIKYWTWEDLKYIIKNKNLDFKQKYKSIISKKRCNLSPKEINFIDKLLENVQKTSQ